MDLVHSLLCPFSLVLLRYSIKRLPGEIALQLMFVIPPVLTAHMLDFNAAGDISFSLTILTLIDPAIAYKRFAAP